MPPVHRRPTGKATKAAAQYRRRFPLSPINCSNCKFVIINGQHRCQLVTGIVDKYHVCDYYKSKK
jgi:hypothetical protein